MRLQSRGQTPKGTSDRQLNIKPHRRRFFTPGKGEQERRFFHARRYAVEAKKALYHGAFQTPNRGGKGNYPNPLKTTLYCVTKTRARRNELWQFSVWSATVATRL